MNSHPAQLTNQAYRRSRWNAILIVLVCGVGFVTTGAAQSPSCGLTNAGPCCVENGSSGCEDASCCELVCAADAFCCDVIWDTTCASLAVGLCDPAACATPTDCPGQGDCCAANGTRGCEDAACCSTVCAIDPSCCDVVWDDDCAATAKMACAPGTCPDSCPGQGDCCAANGTPGCEDAACCSTVCAIDPACCDLVWDESCVALAEVNCAPGTCPDSCPGQGDCCAANGTPGCEDAACCSTVCAIDPACCDLVWDESCVALAEVNCAPGTCPDSCPGQGDCCTANGTPGCDDPACCGVVCALDPGCCDVIWDESCVALAEGFCAPGTCPQFSACPGTGDCCAANGTVGCDDSACCEVVCALDQSCCFVVWDEDCAALAEANCTPGICPQVCPGTGDCCEANGTPSCEDATCCNTVCAVDPTCCDTVWDDDCAALARELCRKSYPCSGDADDDNDVDADDLPTLEVCLSGPSILPDPNLPQFLTCLREFDADVDRDSDLADIAVIQISVGAP